MGHINNKNEIFFLIFFFYWLFLVDVLYGMTLLF